MISAKCRKNKIIARVELFLNYAICHKLVYFYDVFRLPMRAKKLAKKQMERKKLNSICRHFFPCKSPCCQAKVPGKTSIRTDGRNVRFIPPPAGGILPG